MNTLSTDHPPLKIFASRLLKYYSEHFRKRLDPGTYKKDGAAEFFFSRREGFCEHFSGTFATLLRVAGYPSRVVMGFQGGEWNSFSKTWIVRDYHAHAWVEAWSDEDRAWIRFDPTRAVGPFDPPHESQNEFLAYAEGVYTEWNYFYRSEEVEKHFRPSVGFGIVVFISLWLFRRIRKNQNKKDPAFRRFERYCKRLKKLGLERRPNEGPVDFLNRGLIFFANESEEFKNEMKQFTERYVRGRYRGDS